MRLLSRRRNFGVGLSSCWFRGRGETRRRAHGELNLEPSDGATLFAEALYGSATKVVPAYVERLLRGEQTR